LIGRGSHHRLQLVTVLCALPLVAVLLRVGWLETVNGEELRQRAESQHVLRVWLPPHRGRISDRNGEPLAYTMFNYSIVAEPSRVKDPARTARILGKALDLSPRRIEHLLRSRRRQVYLERRVTPMLERRVDLSALPGIEERLELKRVYPQGESSAHVVGYLDDANVGRGGIESTYDELLRGHPGWNTELRDGLGHSVTALGRRSKPAEPGHDVTLTLDATLQDVAASELREAGERLHARGGSFVAVDPGTGEILAMASWPSFDPGRVGRAKPEAMRNRVIVDPYEPGSTFKLVAASTALGDGTLEPGTPIHCEEGSYNFGGYTITDHHPYGTLTFKDCFAFSSNIAFAKVGNLCGERLYDTARALGFGQATGIPLAGEASGVLRPPPTWSRRSAATIAIGYEVMVTPLQMAMAYAAVANGGVLLRPQLVRSIRNSDGKETFHCRRQEVRRVMDPETARTMRGFMRGVMTHGTGSGADISWMEVGGKTGTTEKYTAGGYSNSKHYASFVGIAPLDDPKLVCFIMLDEPDRASSYGGSAAAPVFHEVMEAYGRLPGSSLGPEYDTLVVQKPEVSRSRDWMAPPLHAGPETAGFPGTPSPGHGLPDVRGESLRRALQVLRAYGVTAKVSGTGVVRAQSPAPGAGARGPVRLSCSQEGSGTVVLASRRDAILEERRDARSAGSAGWR